LLHAYKIPAAALGTTVVLLVIGELSTGTSAYFAAMMAIALLCIGITYNMLGGLSSFSGIIFSGFALRNIVISQFAKVILFEAADNNLEAPLLTISIYATFYFCVMVGVWLFGKIRLPLPRPMESLTRTQDRLLYTITFLTGLVSSVVYESYQQAYELVEIRLMRCHSLTFQAIVE
jgi:hypothetical protein